ncbi:MAG TPA: phosphoribosyltransferase family protein [Candidatus Nanoarchaeia archaeon]|nr:phosphoribosyltransferase family protein [Candidatus Nanoarchaeia archaeon]
MTADISRILLESKSLLLRDHRFNSGLPAPLYFDSDLIPPLYRALVIQALSEETRDLEYVAVAGVPTRGEPWAAFHADRNNKILLRIRKVQKSYGTERLIEGLYNKGDRIILIDDTVTTGKTMVTHADKLTDAGLFVVACISLLDFGFNISIQNFQKNGYTGLSLSGLDDLKKSGAELGMIDDSLMARLSSWPAEAAKYFAQRCT